eukprot:TRINITY_DN25651_c0_g1_i1.p1 TRINITY_DN25651_c0_g1~~TRINITY_DN25651_c0_g1_i1.p1  ORF type:complete len:139 (-),score=22.71 TRINITY_DN25651_c0_g1_i1:94-510(-)
MCIRDRCSGLKVLNLSPLSQITEVLDNFLCGCTGPTELDMSPLTQVEVIHEELLRGCSGLTELHLGNISRVKYLDGKFLIGCDKLTTVTNVPPEATLLPPSGWTCETMNDERAFNVWRRSQKRAYVPQNPEDSYSLFH